MRNTKRIAEETSSVLSKVVFESIKILKDIKNQKNNFLYFEFTKGLNLFSCNVRFFENGIFNVKISEAGENQFKRNKVSTNILIMNFKKNFLLNFIYFILFKISFPYLRIILTSTKI